MDSISVEISVQRSQFHQLISCNDFRQKFTFFLITKEVFIWRKASPLCRDPVPQLKPLSKMYFCFYERKASTPRLDLAIEILPRRVENFPYTVNALKRAGPLLYY